MPLREHIVGDSRPALLVLVAGRGLRAADRLRERRQPAAPARAAALGGDGDPARARRLAARAWSARCSPRASRTARRAARWASRSRSWRCAPSSRCGRHACPLMDDVTVDWRVLLFAVCVTLATAVVFGIAPALFASKTDLVRRAHERHAIGERRQARRGCCARRSWCSSWRSRSSCSSAPGCCGRSFERLMSVDAGFRPAGAGALRPAAAERAARRARPRRAPTRFRCARQFADAFVSELRAVPGTQAAAAGFGAPFTGAAENQTRVHIEGDPPDEAERPSLTLWKAVTPGYLETLGVPLVRGRLFTDRDRAGSPRVLVVNEAFVREFLRDADPDRQGGDGRRRNRRRGADAKNESLTEKPVPAHVPPVRPVAGGLSHLPRSVVGPLPASVIATARKRLAALDKSLPIIDAGTYDDVVRSTVSRCAVHAWELVAGVLGVRAVARGGGDLQRGGVRGARSGGGSSGFAWRSARSRRQVARLVLAAGGGAHRARRGDRARSWRSRRARRCAPCSTAWARRTSQRTRGVRRARGRDVRGVVAAGVERGARGSDGGDAGGVRGLRT